MKPRSLLAAVAVLGLASAALAAPGGPSLPGTRGTPPPVTNVPPFPRGVDVLSKDVDEGAITYRLEFSNPSRQAFTGDLWVQRAAPNAADQARVAPFAKVALSIPAGASEGSVTFTDPAGLGSDAGGGCFVRHFILSWGGKGSLGKKIAMTPTCAFTATGTDPTASIPPDTLQAQRQGKLFYHGSTIKNLPACGSGSSVSLFVSTTLKNGSSKAAKVKLTFNNDDGVGVGAYSVPAGASHDGLVTRPMPKSGKYTLTIVDPTSSVGGAIWQPGYYVDVKRTCNPKAALVAE